MGYQKNEKGSIFSLQFPLETSPPHSFPLDNSVLTKSLFIGSSYFH